MTFNRSAGLLCVSLALLSGGAAAQTYPNKPVRIIVPYLPGAITDTLPRLVADKLRDEWNQPVVVENRPGANGRIGTDAVAKSAPDGHTLAVGIVDTMVTAPYLVKNMPYDPARDFAPITILAQQSYVLVARQDVPFATVADLVRAAKASPGKLRFGSWGPGSAAHLSMEMLKAAGGFDLEHIPYKGSAAMTLGLLGGEIDVTFSGYSAVLSHYKAGKVKVLGRASLARMPLTPDVPTIAESGFPAFQVQAWYALFAPAQTPRPVIEQIQRAAARALATPEIRNRLEAFYAEAGGNTPEDFQRLLVEERARWSKLIASLKISME
ncbi:MAG: Bug family tripartite tricarboxylate transporter substrate binding protein [Betaproteobacteria bacterium]